MSLKPKMVDFGKTWGALQETVKGVLTLADVPRATWNDRFSDVYSLCVAYPEPLADRLYDETKHFLNKHVLNILSIVSAAGEANLLQAYHRAWTEYSQGLSYLHRLYLYLNQQHIKKTRLTEAEIIYGSAHDGGDCQEMEMEIGELGLEIWKRKMIAPLQSSLVALLLEGIHADRMGEVQPTTSDVICGVIQSFVMVETYRLKGEMDMYLEIFEKPFLEASGAFYHREAAELLQQSDVTRYMEKVTWRLAQEELRAHKFLHASSIPKVRACCEDKMVSAHVNWLHVEAEAMIVKERKRDLALLYTLLRPLPQGLAPLVQKLTNHITQQGLQAIGPMQGENIHMQFVEAILEVYTKYSNLIEEVFKKDQAFTGALDKACAAVVNHRSNARTPARAPELLAKYCDALLKKSAKGVSEGEIDAKLSRSIIVFKYVDDKDVFQKFYARMLAKRLIHQQSQSMDAEEAMIDRLKQTCGYEFTNKLHRMFTDMSVSMDLNSKFAASLRDSGEELGISFLVYVLQAGAWPLSLPPSPGPFHIPQQLEKSVATFEKFYHAQFNGRKLTWLHHLCQGELKLNYLKKSYLVTVQTYQMALLLLFETCDEITCKDAAISLRLSHEQLVKHALSLVDCKILKKIGDHRELEDDSLLMLNFDYYNKRTKFRVTGALQREQPHDTEATHRSVEDDRKLYLQAAIVRIMKSRKLLRHNQLVQEVLEQSRVNFAPSIGMIKKCIEALIDKQYIERTPNSADEYSYVA